MSTQISEQDIQKIVQSVLRNVEAAIKDQPSSSASSPGNTPVRLKQAVHPSQEARSHVSAGTAGRVSAGTASHVSAGTTGQGLDSSQQGDQGVFSRMEDAVEAGHHAQLVYMRNFQLKDRERILSAIRQAVLDEK